MSYALTQSSEPDSQTASADAPVVIIGTGPVGIRVLQLLMKQDPLANVVIYGNEPWEPYNRVQLSSFLAGELDWTGLVREQSIPPHGNVIQHHNCAVARICRDDQTVVDELGRVQAYSRLIIATGSSPHIPNIRGIDLPGVYRFRDLSDVEKLVARRTRSRRTIVLGGGVLGLEAARAMSRLNTEVYIVDHGNRLMSAQLDMDAAELLKERVIAMGIRVCLNTGVKEILGETRVTGVMLRNDIQINCDTIVVAAGIRPNVDLARDARLSVGRGIRVNDNMQTSDENIYAIGECAEHRDKVYGLVAPGYEQARVAGYCLRGESSNYKGSIAATRLKVVGLPVFSMGSVDEEMVIGSVQNGRFQDHSRGIYRKILLQRGRLIGAISIGDWDQIDRIQEAITNKRYIWPWQLKRFSRSGELWPDEATRSIAQWPASTTVCNCIGVCRGELSQAITAGCVTVEALIDETRASTVCGSCRPKLAELIGSTPAIQADIRAKSLLVFSIVALLTLVSLSFLPNLIYNPTVDVLWQWDKLWRSSLLKQITGYTAAVSMALAALISLRKRWKKITFFNYANWRVVHLVLTVLALLALMTHTGLRMGNNINFYLMMTVLGISLVGVVVGAVISIQHKLDYVLAGQIREKSLWGHILFLWPLPVLLGFHIFKTYYY